MTTVNLTQLHKIITRRSAELNVFGTDTFEYSLQITPTTSNSTFSAFVDNIKSVNEVMIRSKNKFIDDIQTIKQLKLLLNAANTKAGIDNLMIEASFIMKEISFLQQAVTRASYPYENYKYDMSMSLDDIKSTFTDTCRKYAIHHAVLSDIDIYAINTYINSLKSHKASIDDKIASLNQTTFVEIDI